MKFICDQCGECCRNLKMSELYSELDSGDGSCKFLKGNLCTIYERRPILCRIDECYDHFFSDEMTKEEFYRKNYEVCRYLKEKAAMAKQRKEKKREV